AEIMPARIPLAFILRAERSDARARLFMFAVRAVARIASRAKPLFACGIVSPSGHAGDEIVHACLVLDDALPRHFEDFSLRMKIKKSDVRLRRVLVMMHQRISINLKKVVVG